MGTDSLAPTIVVLDLDGVILKTNLIKYRAMLGLFIEYQAEQSPISAYILAHGGVPRREKLGAILREIVGITPTEAILAPYLVRYAAALEHELAIAPMVEGIGAFLAAGEHTFYVSSSAPEHEVQQQLATRNLRPYFAAIYGGQTPKATALRQICAAHPTATVLFFGDALGDLLAAQAVGVPFVGVINERDNFAGERVIKLADFATPALVQQAMQQALTKPR